MSVLKIVKSLTKITNQLNKLIEKEQTKIREEEDVQAASRSRVNESHQEMEVANKWLEVLPSVK